MAESGKSGEWGADPPAVLGGEDGDRLELRILAYQFPEEPEEYWDANWLVVRVAARVPRGSWSAIDPCLLTADVARLSEWFEAIANGAVIETTIDFMEPNLSFELKSTGADDAYLRVWFELELRPPWASREGAGARDQWADLQVSKEELRMAARDLRAQLKQFPPRAVGVRRS